MEWLYPELKRSNWIGCARPYRRRALELHGCDLRYRFCWCLRDRSTCVGFVEAFANTLKNVRGRKQIKLDRDMISASDSSKVHRPTAAMRNALWRLLARSATVALFSVCPPNVGKINPTLSGQSRVRKAAVRRPMRIRPRQTVRQRLYCSDRASRCDY